MNYRVREDCRLCTSPRLTKVLELPPTPLANEFPTKPNVEQEKFPLWLAACGDCGHVQLPVVVDPERLFRDYVYVSGTSKVFVEHFRKYAYDLVAKHMAPGDLVVEVGSNDGTMLRFFKDAGMRVTGVDPAVALAARATEAGLHTVGEFFTAATAQKILDLRGPAKVVVANNVFAHADDLRSIALAVKSLLDEDGAFVFEVSYLADVLNKTLFDTIYHEHLAFHSVEPLVGFFRKLDMSLVDARRVDTHGGSIRVTVSPQADRLPSLSAAALIAEERALGLGTKPARAFDAFTKAILDRRDELLRLLRGAKMGGKRIAAYGAPAKATTLLHTFGLEDGMLDFVVDDSQHKQGRYMPGTDIPVLPSAAIGDRRPDYVLLLAWNFADSILEKLAPYRAAGGKCIVPLPNVRVID